DRRHQTTHAFAELDFERTRRAEARALAGGRRERRDEPAGRVSVNERPPRHHEVDEPIAVHIFQPRAGGAADEQRRRADRLECADGAVDTSGEHIAGPREQTTRRGDSHAYLFDTLTLRRSSSAAEMNFCSSLS